MTILSGNHTVNEFEGATRQRELAQARLEAKLANERAIAAAHRMPGGGPQVTASTEAQPQHQRPRINVSGA